ncbi:MAG: hypothetical protein N3A65_06680 [candidate division WOR-3 bacterium]|nr:hypothetical protein [candidate division WOR-3 bacterium]
MRLILSLMLILPVILSGRIIYGGPGDRISGFAPGDTLVCTLKVTVKVPARIGLYVLGNTEFDLSNPILTYPPAVFPGYYNPTSVQGTNNDGINLQVFSNSPTMTWHLETRGSGNFTTTVALDQLYYAPNGEPDPQDGQDPPGGNWRSFTTTFVEIANGGKTNGWIPHDQDYIFQAEEDDEPTPAAGATTTIYYRLYAQ